MDSLPCTLMIPAAGDSLRFQSRTGVPKGLVNFGWNNHNGSMIEHIVPRDWDGPVRVGVKITQVPLFKDRLPEHYIVQGMPATSGQAETVRNMAFFARDGQDIMVVNCDNGFDPWILRDFLRYCREMEACVGAITFQPSSGFERYGYVDRHPNFTIGVEKDPISKHALAGAFYFSSPKMIISRAGLGTHYISEWFIDMPRPKLSFQIPERSLYEWGTAELLENSIGMVHWEVA